MTNKEEKETVVQEEKKKKSIKDTSIGRFNRDLFHNLIHDKLFLLSFLLTLFFLGLFLNNATKGSEGYFQKLEEKYIKKDNKVEPTVDVDINGKAEEILDVTSLVGIYSREVVLSESVKVTDSCEISSYKLVYKIENDKSINKYFMNDCLGVFRIWNDKLKYNTSNSARYISAHDINYLFSNTGIKEVDGETYRIDESISSISGASRLYGARMSFLDNNIIISSDTSLLIIKGNSVVLNTKKDYANNGGTLDKTFYPGREEGKYTFIVFNNGESLNCYESYEENNDKVLYKIYSIDYDSEKKAFNEPKVIVERKINDGCKNWENDFNLLSQ